MSEPVRKLGEVTDADGAPFSRLYFDAEAEAEKWQQEHEEGGHV